MAAATSNSAEPGLLAAFGMILGVQNAHRIVSPRLGAISNSTKSFAWRLVVTPRFAGNRSALHLLVPCHDAPDGVAEKSRDNLLYPGSFKQTSCACKSLWWFYRAVDLYRDAAFIGKVEDDTVVQPELLERELRWALARRPAGAQRTWLGWYSLFQISLHRWDARIAARWPRQSSPLVGGWCQEGVKAWHKEYVRCHESWPNATVAPFASGGIDVRSWALAHFSSHACRLPWNDEYQAACDGDQGYDIARCLAGLDPATARRFAPPVPAEGAAVDLFDLSERKFCRYPDGHCSVQHPNKGGRGYKSTWRMSTPSLAPVELRWWAVAEAERNRVAMRWKARNVTASQTFRKLWRERTSTVNMCAEDPKLCWGDPE